MKQAQWVAARHRRVSRDGLVFAAIVAPNTVLALIADPDGRAQSEVVVDPTGLPPAAEQRGEPPAVRSALLDTVQVTAVLSPTAAWVTTPWL